MATSKSDNGSNNETQKNDKQENENLETDSGDGSSQDAKMNASFTSIEVSDGKGETKMLTEAVMAERQKLRRSPTESHAGGSTGILFRLNDRNPYTNESPFSAYSEKKF